MRVVWHGQADGKSRMLAGMSVCLFQADCRVITQYALQMKGGQSILSPACMREPARLRLYSFMRLGAYAHHLRLLARGTRTRLLAPLRAFATLRLFLYSCACTLATACMHAS